jgi:hypothetical protein
MAFREFTECDESILPLSLCLTGPSPVRIPRTQPTNN